MNANREEPAAKKELADALLAIDSQTSNMSTEGREVAKKVLRRDRRRVQILTWMTVGFFLLTVVGICGSLYFYHVKVTPSYEKFNADATLLAEQLDKREPKPSEPDLLRWTMGMAAGSSYTLFMIQYANLWGTLTLVAVTLATIFCTVLLITASRRATLRQIEVNLLALSKQFDALQQSLRDSPSIGRNQPG